MKEIITIALSIITLYSKAQTDTIYTLKRKDTMEYFDINKYKDWEVNPLYKTSPSIDKHLINGSKQVRLLFDEKGIIEWEEIREENSPYQLRRFYYPNGLLKYEYNLFYDFKIGKTKNYDEIGRFIGEEDNDKGYMFSITDLREKLKKEFGIDIVKDYDDKCKWCITIFREGPFEKSIGDYPSNIPYYQILYKEKDSKIMHYIYMSGADGKIFYHGVREGRGGKFKEVKDNKVPSEKRSSSLFIEETTHPKELGVPYKQGGDYPAGTYRLYNDRAFTKKEWELYVKTRPWWERLFLS